MAQEAPVPSLRCRVRAGRCPGADPTVTVLTPTSAPTTLERNLESLAKTSPRAARLIAGAAPAASLEWIEAPDGGLSAVYQGRALASRRRPVEEARRLAESVDLSDAATVVFLGFGVGAHVIEMASRVERHSLVVVFEPDVELLRAVLERVDLSDALSRANILLLTDETDGASIAAGLRGAEALVAIGVRIIEHPPSKARLGAKSPVFTQTLASTVESLRTTVVTTMVQTEITIRNALMNVRAYSCGVGIDDLQGLCAGRLGVVVSAGPSLRRNLHLLADPEVRSRVLVVAVQTVLKPMLEAGIRPDIVTALDHHEISRRFYEGLAREDVEGITLIAEPKANAAIIDAWPGAVRLLRSDVLDQLLGKDLAGEHGALEAGATVAHLAYYVARHMGCDPVALIGQDLAFTDGQYYAPGAAIHNVWACELNPFNTLEMMEWQRIVRGRANLHERRDHLGRPVYTDDQMATYLAQFERDFASDKDRGLTIIDATEGGVRKAHTEVMPLSRAIEQHARAGTDPVPEIPGAPDSERPSQLRRLRRKLEQIEADARRVASMSREAEALLDRMERAGADQAKLAPLIDRVHEIRSRVERTKPAYDLVHRMNQTGTFKRFKADREMALNEPGSALEEQRRRIERDKLNVSWLAEAGDILADLIGRAARSLPPTEEAKLTSDVARAASDDSGHAESRVLGLILDTGVDAELLAQTRAIVDRIEGLDAIEVRPAVVDARTRAARAWAGSCWRGGLGGATVWDEVFDPDAAGAALQSAGCDAALVVGADWIHLDPDLCSRIIERHRSSPDARALAFCQAPPGIAGCVIGRELVDGLGEGRRAGDPLATIGGVLAYRPARPRPDPIAGAACVSIEPKLRDSLVRCIGDEAMAPSVESVEASPREVVIELCAAREDAEGESMEAARFERVIGQLRDLETPVLLTLGGRGDPLCHDQSVRCIETACNAGLAGVHVRTELLADASIVEALAGMRVDVISVDLHADSPARYAAVRGLLRHADAMANIDRLLNARSGGVPWIVPRISRRDEVYEDIEPFVERAAHVLGAFVIDPLERPIEGARIEPLSKPAGVAWRDARRRMLILADGTVPSDEREPASGVGNVFDAGVLGAWSSLARIREAARRNPGVIRDCEIDPLWTGW